MKRALLVVVLLSAAWLQVRLVSRIGLDGENTPDESETLYGLHAVRNGSPLYRDWSQPPHVLTPHPPLMYVVPGAVARAVGADMLQSFVIGRACIYLAWLGVAWAIFALARQSGAPRLEAGIGALLWLSGSLARENAVSFRPDAPALLLSLAGLWWYRRGQPVGAILALAAAAFHRYSAVAAVIVIVAEEWSHHRRASAFRLAAIWAGILGAGVAGMEWLTGGQFLRSTVGITGIGAGWARVESLLGLSLWRGVLGFVAGTLALALVRGESARPLRRYFIVSLAIAFATSWKFGSGFNYYLEPFAAGCVLTALFVREQSLLRNVWLAAAIAIIVWRVNEPLPWVQPYNAEGDPGGRSLIEDGYLALRRDGAPFLLNASLFAELQKIGQFDDSALLQQIEAGKFAAIITTAPVEKRDRFRPFPARWLTAIERNYTLTQNGPVNYVYRPIALENTPTSPP